MAPVSAVEKSKPNRGRSSRPSGTQFGDVCLLRWEDVHRDGEGGPSRVVYLAETTGKETAVSLPPEAAETLGRYGDRAARGRRSFPFLSRHDVSTPAKRRAAVGSLNAYANAKLRVLARRPRLSKPDDLTFHVARHSLAAHIHDAGLSAVAT